MKRLFTIAAALFVSACASSGIPLVENLSTCDLPATAICAWEAEAEKGINDVIDMADSRICIDIVTRCPDPVTGASTAVDCPVEDCQIEPMAGDRTRRVITVDGE